MYALFSILLFLPLCYSTEGFDDPNLFHFVTRPDLRPPKWNFTVYNESLLSPGYWFVSPKQSQRRTIGSGEARIGPAIYDGRGELIWSGTTQLDASNINDFRVSDVEGEPLLTMYDRDRRSGVLLDHHYRVRQIIEIVKRDSGESVNAHEFKFVDNGKRVLVIRNRRQDATKREKKAVGFKGDVCWATYNNLYELDVDTGKTVFHFDPHGQIGIDESDIYNKGRDVEFRCKNGWDFMHANSLDKCDDGHYLLGARHTNTLYKISKDDGSVLWRLGGSQSNFSMDGVVFSRQHDVRCRGQNETHTIISILDNALGEDQAPPTYDYSRGLLIAVNTVNMTASLLAHYNHPDNLLAQRRGNMQILDNGNVFMGWSEHAYQSEHSPDGTLLMKGRLMPDRLGSYRNYKFEFVGRPLTRPDVHASVYLDLKHQATTRVYVSWNGDTEVRQWHLYKTSADGKNASLIASAHRKGFETALEYKGNAQYVYVEGVGQDGESAGRSDVTKTIEHPSDPESPDALRENKLEENGRVSVTASDQLQSPLLDMH